MRVCICVGILFIQTIQAANIDKTDIHACGWFCCKNIVKLRFNIVQRLLYSVEVSLDIKYLDDYDEYANIKYGVPNNNNCVLW